jgi:hypothetical protein
MILSSLGGLEFDCVTLLLSRKIPTLVRTPFPRGKEPQGKGEIQERECGV